jgi:hypothetical protein
MTSSLPQRPSPDQVIVKIFSLGLNDSDLEVRSFCSEALCTVENIIHPRLPILGARALFSCSATARGEWNNTAGAPECLQPSGFEMLFPNKVSDACINCVAASDVENYILTTNESTAELFVQCTGDSHPIVAAQGGLIPVSSGICQSSGEQPGLAEELKNGEDEAVLLDSGPPVEDVTMSSEVQQFVEAGHDRSLNSAGNDIKSSDLPPSSFVPDAAAVLSNENPETTVSSLTLPVVAEMENSGAFLPNSKQDCTLKRKRGSDSESIGDNSDSEAIEIEPTVLELMVQSFSYKEPR